MDSSNTFSASTLRSSFLLYPSPYLVSYLHRHTLVSLFLSLVSALPYIFMIDGKFCYDDKVAVGGNPDVCLTNVTMYDIFTHDYWGNDILRRRMGGWTHDSWRPLVTLSFRFNHRLLSGLETWSYHLTNILINCVCVWLMYYFLLAIFTRCNEEYRLLTTTITDVVSSSPVSSFSVSSFVTDPAASIISPRKPTNTSSGNDDDTEDSDIDDSTEDEDTERKPTVSLSSSSTIRRSSSTVQSSFSVVSAADYRQYYTDLVSFIGGLCFALHPIHSESVSNITSRADPMATIAILLGALQYLQFKPAKLRILFSSSTLSVRSSKNLFQQSKQFYALSLRWLITFFWVLVGLLCKETALTALVIYTVFDLLLTLPRIGLAYRIALLRYEYSQYRSATSSSPPSSPASSSIDSSFSSSSSTSSTRIKISVLQQWKFFLYELYSYLPLLRTVFTLFMAGLLYYVRIILFSHGYSLQEFANEMHNPLVLIQPWYLRWLAIAYVQSWAIGSLIFPIFLSHEHAGSFPIQGWDDYRNGLTVIIYTFILTLIGYTFYILGRYVLVTSKDLGLETNTDSTRQKSNGTDLNTLTMTQSKDNEGSPTSLSALTISTESNPVLTDTKPTILTSSSVSIEPISDVNDTTFNDSVSNTLSVSSNSPTRRTVRFHTEDIPIPSTPSRKTKKSKPTKLSSSTQTSSRDPASKKDNRNDNPPTESEFLHQHLHNPSFTTQYHRLLFAIRILLYLAWTLLSYAPASHAFLYVAFVVAERTLYFPSVGMCCLLGELFTHLIYTYRYPFPSSSSVSVSRSYRIMAYLSRVSLPCLLVYYGIRSGIRNLDWTNEETLLSSNLRLYPTNNGMTIYGIGAVHLYKGDYDKAEYYLLEAINQTSLAEPYIMLGQMYWRYKHDYPKAIHYFSRLENTSTPRKEIMQNLGLLLILTHQAPDSDPVARRHAEYLVLLGYGAHGYPMGHPNIGTLAANAACIRLLSEPHHYGNYQLADQLFEEALKYRHNTRPTTIRNAAYFYAITGQPERALQILDEGEEFIRSLTLAPDLPPSAFEEADEYIQSFRIIRLAIRINMPTILQWQQEILPYGKTHIEKRLTFMGGECTMELLYW